MYIKIKKNKKILLYNSTKTDKKLINFTIIIDDAYMAYVKVLYHVFLHLFELNTCSRYRFRMFLSINGVRHCGHRVTFDLQASQYKCPSSHWYTFDDESKHLKQIGHSGLEVTNNDCTLFLHRVFDSRRMLESTSFLAAS